MAHGKRRGFTLVEMIVSLALFSVVATVALGALVKIVSANRKAQTLQTALTNLNSALESMSRELRVGKQFHCYMVAPGSYSSSEPVPQGCNVIDADTNSPQDLAIEFQSTRTTGYPPCPLNTTYHFKWDTTDNKYHIQKVEQKTCGNAYGPGDGQDILDLANLTLTEYQLEVGPFYPGGDPDKPYNLNSVYPYVYLRLVGYAGNKPKEKTDFDIQTTISSRHPQK